MATGRKRCVVAYATREQQWLWNVELPDHATVAEALEQARAVAKRDDIPWDSAPLGIFGQSCQRTISADNFVPGATVPLATST